MDIRHAIAGVIVAVVLVIAILWATGAFGDMTSPIVSTEFGGSWEQEVVVTYADGTTKTMGNAGTATLYNGDAVINRIECYLYVNPTNIEGGDFTTLALDFSKDLSDFTIIYDTIAPSGAQELMAIEVPLMYPPCPPCDKLTELGPRTFQIDTTTQLVGLTGLPADLLDEYILQEEGDYILEIYYTGSVQYTLDGGYPGSVPAPDGVITIDFSRALIAGTINFGWSSTPEVN